MNDEVLDLVDMNDELVGTVLKNQAHGNPGLIHREIAVAVFNDSDEVLIQQRSMNKLTGAGEWKISLAGHVIAREEPHHAAKREAKEELGLEIEPVFFKKIFLRSGKETAYAEARFFYLYYAEVTGHPALTLDAEEVMDAKWVNALELSNINPYNVDGLSLTTILEIAEMLKKEKNK